MIGHSMGSLVALEAAARASGAAGLVLIGSAATMPVHPDLLAAAAANEHAAIDMVNLWGYGYAAGLGGSPPPASGWWAQGSACCRARRPGVLYNDLAACNAYRDGLAAAAQSRGSDVA